MDAIPPDQPFVVRARYGRQALLLGGVTLLAVTSSAALAFHSAGRCAIG